MNAKRLPPILCVDDDENVIQGLVRVLRGRFDITTARGGHKALAAIEERGPFAVIVADLRMPYMDGIKLLRRVRDVAPYTVRVLFTGEADFQTAIAAVNDGHIFRFIAKPCAPRDLIAVLNDAVRQYRLEVSERVLLEKTLHGSIRVLTDILALTHPAAFGRATRARKIVGDLAGHTGAEDRWVAEIAAMLSEIGCVTLPPETAARLYEGRDLSEDEVEMARRLPGLAIELLTNIPRLDPVIDVLRYQHKHYDGHGQPEDDVRGLSIPWGARALRIAHDFDALLAKGHPECLALQLMRGRAGWYDPALLEALTEVKGIMSSVPSVIPVRLSEMRPGMISAQDVRTRTGALLIAHGQEVTISLAARLRNLGRGDIEDATVQVMLAAPADRSDSVTGLLRQRGAFSQGANDPNDADRHHSVVSPVNPLPGRSGG